MFHVQDSYPPDAAGGAADFLTGAAQRDVIEGDVRRKEKVIVADRLLGTDDYFEGRICISEQTVRRMGQEIGLFDRPAMLKLEVEANRLRARIDQVDAQNVALKAVIRGFEDTELVRVLYVAPDGREFGSRAALDAAAAVDPTEPLPVHPYQEVPT